eukprot:gene8244-1472_t
MFYSTWVLTWKGPLAKVWLASTWDKKLTKQDIKSINMKETVGMLSCKPPGVLGIGHRLSYAHALWVQLRRLPTPIPAVQIVSPVVPLALRLCADLMWGCVEGLLKDSNAAVAQARPTQATSITIWARPADDKEREEVPQEPRNARLNFRALFAQLQADAGDSWPVEQLEEPLQLTARTPRSDSGSGTVSSAVPRHSGLAAADVDMLPQFAPPLPGVDEDQAHPQPRPALHANTYCPICEIWCVDTCPNCGYEDGTPASSAPTPLRFAANKSMSQHTPHPMDGFEDPSQPHFGDNMLPGVYSSAKPWSGAVHCCRWPAPVHTSIVPCPCNADIPIEKTPYTPPPVSSIKQTTRADSLTEQTSQAEPIAASPDYSG